MLDNGVPPQSQDHASPHLGEPGWQDIELETIAAENCDALNDAYTIRAIAGLELGSHKLGFVPSWRPEQPEIANAWTVTIRADDRTAELVVPEKLLQSIIASIDPTVQLAALSDEIRPLLLEFALQSAFEALEAALGCPLSVETARPGEHRIGDAEHVAIFLRTQLDGAGQGWAALRAHPEQLRDLTSYLADLAVHDHQRVDVPLPVCVRWGSVDLTLSELRSLAPGDVVLVDEACREPGLAVAVIGEHMVAPVEVLRTGYRLFGHPRRAGGSGFEWSLDRHRFRYAPTADAAMEHVPFRLFFQLGDFELERKAVAELATGAVLELARPLEEGLDLIVAGSRIGRGEMVTIGSADGIRVTRLQS